MKFTNNLKKLCNKKATFFLRQRIHSRLVQIKVKSRLKLAAVSVKLLTLDFTAFNRESCIFLYA